MHFRGIHQQGFKIYSLTIILASLVINLGIRTSLTELDDKALRINILLKYITVPVLSQEIMNDVKQYFQ